MAGLLYFAADLKSIGTPDLDRWGLLEVFRGATIHQRGVLRAVGPGSSCGVAFRPHTLEPRQPVLGCWPADSERPEARQAWEPLLGADGVWIGHYTDQPPTPADLARPEQVAGHYTELEDGSQWLIPVARAFPCGTSLPERLLIGEDNTWVREVVPRYAQLSRRAGEFFAGCEEQQQFIVEDWADLACEAIAVNYRIDRRGASHLKLLTTTSLHRVLTALVDGPTIEAVLAEQQANQKKNRPDGSPSSDGGAD